MPSRQNQQSLLCRMNLLIVGLGLISGCASTAFDQALTTVPRKHDDVYRLATAPAQQAAARNGQTNQELAKKSQNPVSDLIILPFQNNTNFDIGPGNEVQNILNVQPVVPVNVGDDWKLINRMILPIVKQPELLPGQGSETGMGDISFTAFLSPRKPGKLIWGVGPIVQLPTASDSRLGARRWGLGPSALALTISGPWVVGGLINNLWSVGGSDRPDINQMLIQPFVNYNLPRGWYVSSAPIITANWEANSSERWTVPIGGGVGKILKFGEQPINVSLQAYHNIEHPRLAAEWTLRFSLAFIF